MSLLFFDCETTGKAEFRLPPDAPCQPRIVQLAALMLGDDWSELGSLNFIIKPDGFEIPEEASEIHGITQEIAIRNGVKIATALWGFLELSLCCNLLVAHNCDFDRFLVKGEVLRRKQTPASDALLAKLDLSTFCTMRATTSICKLPGNYGDYKWPKLQEAHRHIFRSEFEDAHDAMADVRACSRIYRWLMEQNKVAEKQP